MKTVDKATASVGDTLNYVVTVDNTGTGVLTNLLITDQIPTGTTYIANSATSGGVFESTTNAITWNVPALGAGQSVLVGFSVTINEGAPTTITNIASACPLQLPCQEATATTSLVAVLGEKITRAAAQQQLPLTGSDRIVTLLLALSILGTGITFSMRVEGKHGILR